MHLSRWLLIPCTILSSVVADNFTRSSKRGLIYIPNAATPEDNNVWLQPGSDLTWYYNYNATPSAQYSSNPSFQFVPMLWGAPSSTSDTTFLTTVKNLISSGTNITYALGFNEPDGSFATGGSNITPQLAAQTWIRELEPLRALGVKLGAPAVTGAQTGFTWLSDFFSACNGGCTADFMTVHWYGDFQGLASNMGQKRAAYPNLTLWITEYALENSNLSATQNFFNESADYFDRLDYVIRYAYFGSFRSSKSNVGPNVAMLTQNGQLTDIGSWYLGGAATNNIPSEAASMRRISLVALIVVGACFWVL